MTERDSYAPGTPSWVDLGTPDPAAASAFYTALFGWEVNDLGPEAGNYRMCMLRGKPVAGLGPQMNTDMPPWWTTYISVASADATVAKITAAGGTVVVPAMDVMDAGRMAVAMDPAGAVFSIWQPGMHAGSGIVNEPGTLCWNELATRNPDSQAAFYGAVFGWTASHNGPPMNYTEFQLDSESVAGMMPMEGDMWPADLPDHWMVYFAVADCDAAAARIQELGGSISVPPTDIPPGRFAVVADPQGAMFSLLTFSPRG